MSRRIDGNTEPQTSGLAVSYSRVSSDEQKKGFSLESQVQTERTYAASKGFRIVEEFSFAESAKEQGRKHFNDMISYVRQHHEVRIIIVEKMDRFCRNLEDFVDAEKLVQDLNIEIHFVKDNQVLRRGAKSQEKLVQGIFAVLSRNYILNLQEEILKGQLVKAEKGQYPGRARYGYQHDQASRTITADPTRAAVVKLIFQLFSSGVYSVDSLRKKIINLTGEKISKSNLHNILTARFYLGLFTWRRREYQGIHPQLVDSVTFEQVQDILAGRGGRKSNSGSLEFPFKDLMHCVVDGCDITAEKHKGKYHYYHCTFGRGKHKFPYLREEQVAEMLGKVLKGIEIPRDFCENIIQSLGGSQQEIAAKRQEEISRLKHDISVLDARIQDAYVDKLDKKIDEDFWLKNTNVWTIEKRRLEDALVSATASTNKSQVAAAAKTLELAQVAHSSYFTMDYRDRAQLLKMVLSNCETDGVSLYPTYRKPFDVIFEGAKNEDWRREGDSNPR